MPIREDHSVAPKGAGGQNGKSVGKSSNTDSSFKTSSIREVFINIIIIIIIIEFDAKFT